MSNQIHSRGGRAALLLAALAAAAVLAIPAYTGATVHTTGLPSPVRAHVDQNQPPTIRD